MHTRTTSLTALTVVSSWSVTNGFYASLDMWTEMDEVARCSGLQPDDSDSTGNCTFLGCSNWNLRKATTLDCWRRCPLLTAQATECSRGVAIGIYAGTCRQGWMGLCTFRQASLATQTAEGSWSVTTGIFAGTLGQHRRRFLQESLPLLTAQTVG